MVDYGPLHREEACVPEREHRPRFQSQSIILSLGDRPKSKNIQVVGSYIFASAPPCSLLCSFAQLFGIIVDNKYLFSSKFKLQISSYIFVTICFVVSIYIRNLIYIYIINLIYIYKKFVSVPTTILNRNEKKKK